jgi:hypothetical protein
MSIFCQKSTLSDEIRPIAIMPSVSSHVRRVGRRAIQAVQEAFGRSRISLQERAAKVGVSLCKYASSSRADERMSKGLLVVRLLDLDGPFRGQHRHS